MVDILKELLERELQKLEEEIKSFTDESLIWKTSEGVTNSSGNLCLHLCGNLQHFIGTILGKSDYVRNRDAEFSSRNISKANLLEEIQHAKKSVTETLGKISDEDLQAIYPQTLIKKDVTIAYFLVHLISHFDYHLGQINYLRRMIVND